MQTRKLCERTVRGRELRVGQRIAIGENVRTVSRIEVTVGVDGIPWDALAEANPIVCFDNGDWMDGASLWLREHLVTLEREMKGQVELRALPAPRKAVKGFPSIPETETHTLEFRTYARRTTNGEPLE